MTRVPLPILVVLLAGIAGGCSDASPESLDPSAPSESAAAEMDPKAFLTDDMIKGLLREQGIEPTPEMIEQVRASATVTTSTSDMPKPDLAGMSEPDATAMWDARCSSEFEAEVGRGGVSASAIPWLTIYGGTGTPYLHSVGYRPAGQNGWNDALKAAETVDAPVYTTLQDFADIPDLEPDTYTFVKYSADWCAPCKAQSVDLQDFKTANPQYNIAHVEIDVDDVIKQRGQGKCPV